jgi:hypothetical protein
MKKTLFTLFIVILIICWFFIYNFFDYRYVYNWDDYLKLERIWNILYVNSRLAETVYEPTSIQYRIESNNIYLWCYKRYYKFVKWELPKIKIKLKNRKYNVFYLNQDWTTVFIKKN